VTDLDHDPDSSDPDAYLCVDQFLKTGVDARAIKTAFELGLIDRLRAAGECSFDSLCAAAGADRAGTRVVLDLLALNLVIVESREGIRLCESFRKALSYQDLLQAKIDFAELVAPDFFNLFTWMVRDPARFMREARLFKLFDYRRCLDHTPENYEVTRRWMTFTTALTRYESGVCLHHHDFRRHQSVLDVGGNSGEFAIRICRKHPQIQATVFDLPVVCRVGREHVQPHPEATRIGFVEGNAMADPLPPGADLISFKSMLHDWPDGHARQLISAATSALSPGGTLLIFERSRMDISQSGMPWSLVPMLLFFRSFRSPTFYEDYLRKIGYQDVQTRQIRLDTPFILVTARKPK
jgi:ubiquinone/menaquinone biosynthesis C-methylase UbiE